VEMSQYLSGQRGDVWVRTGFSVDAFSFTAQDNSLAIAQPVCRARLAQFSGAVYSASTEECQSYAKNLGFAVDGMMFMAALPTSTVCPVGSSPVREMVRQDSLGYNIRTLQDSEEIYRMSQSGWITGRIAFCAPN